MNIFAKFTTLIRTCWACPRARWHARLPTGWTPPAALWPAQTSRSCGYIVTPCLTLQVCQMSPVKDGAAIHVLSVTFLHRFGSRFGREDPLIPAPSRWKRSQKSQGDRFSKISTIMAIDKIQKFTHPASTREGRTCRTGQSPPINEDIRDKYVRKEKKKGIILCCQHVRFYL